MTDKPNKSMGRKSVQVSAKPQELMTGKPQLAHAWTAQVITLFPDAFPGLLGESLTGKALKDGIWQLNATDLRRYGVGKHRNVDDTPSGGGAGMVLRADVVANAIGDTRRRAKGRMPLIYLSPRGVPFTQKIAQDLSEQDGVTLLCGRFEGVDERVLDHYDIIEISMGDYVLTGGELPAMTKRSRSGGVKCPRKSRKTDDQIYGQNTAANKPHRLSVTSASARRIYVYGTQTSHLFVPALWLR
jgi:tRNA (guanine37-N1)-methyltransferase